MKITQEKRAALLADLEALVAEREHGEIWERDTLLLSAIIPGLDSDVHKTIPLPRITLPLETVKMPQIITIAHLRRLFGVGIGE